MSRLCRALCRIARGNSEEHNDPARDGQNAHGCGRICNPARWLVPEGAALRGVLAGGDAEGMPAIHVSPLQGRWLHVLAKAIGTKGYDGFVMAVVER